MDESIKAAVLAGARLMHTEDQHEVVCFTPASLTAFLAAERERCARLVEEMCDYTGGQGGPATPTPSHLAAAIRKEWAMKHPTAPPDATPPFPVGMRYTRAQTFMVRGAGHHFVECTEMTDPEPMYLLTLGPAELAGDPPIDGACNS